jgi:uncharacterized membrane protein
MPFFLKKIISYLFTGMLVILPVLIISVVVRDLFVWINNRLSSLIGTNFPVVQYNSLLVIIFLLLIAIVGILARNYFGKKVIDICSATIKGVPLFNKLFIVIQQIMDVLLRPQKNIFSEVVLVEYPTENVWSLGFITSRDTKIVSDAIGQEMVCVFIPSSPTVASGSIVYVNESRVVKVNLDTELAVKTIISAGLVSSAKNDDIVTSQRSLSEVLRRWKAQRAAKKAFFDPRD